MTDNAMTMDDARVLQILDAYGADQERWPVAERHAALERIARTATLAAAWAAARDLDDKLSSAPAGFVSERFLAEIYASAPAAPPTLRPAQSRTSGPVWHRIVTSFFSRPGPAFGAAAQPAAFMLIAGVIGVGVGVWSGSGAALTDTIAYLDLASGGLDTIDGFTLEITE